MLQIVEGTIKPEFILRQLSLCHYMGKMLFRIGQ